MTTLLGHHARVTIPEPDPDDPLPAWLHEHIMSAVRPALEGRGEINALERMWEADENGEE
ncbi:hypothetical protein GCM10010156_73460 [Planobispora rosea]|uniref:Uncharacterized protein n=1 Tax=Planobispora rosea TaxID=35762 RepID=A0A8J3S7R9_PLARO|nr:hypothetical protein [Planobispora rosea]GGT05050.1 hypothetical protein GCM10010156_73460 [Planobispora rosea]GIH88853.1 hypothetical protein Pro02_72610 [Planobispora rosea]